MRKQNEIQIGQYLIRGASSKIVADSIAHFMSNKSFRLKEARYDVNGKTVVVKVRPV